MPPALCLMPFAYPTMITLADIAKLKVEAQETHADMLDAVKQLAEQNPGGREAVARLEGAARELEILRKLELDLLATGKAGNQTLPQKLTEIDSDALLPRPSSGKGEGAKQDPRGTAGAKESTGSNTAELILAPADDEAWIDQPASHEARLDAPGTFDLPAAAVCGPSF